MKMFTAANFNVKPKKIDRMKKYLFFLSMMGIALLTACSSEDDLAASQELTPEDEAAIIAEAGRDSEIPIRLGFGSNNSNFSSVTRAPLESDDAGLFSTPADTYLGLFCLAQKPQVPVANPGPKAEANIAWNADASLLTYLMAANQPARVVKLEGASNTIGNVTTSQHVSEVQFLDPSDFTQTKHYYYPYGNWYNYYFYGYYPRQTSGVTIDAKKVTVAYTLDGTQDIIWGKAMPTTSTPSANPESDIDRGFNAKYFRDKQDPSTGENLLEELPNLTLGHKLAQLRFYVRCTDIRYNTVINGADAEAKAANFKLADLQLINVPTGWNLTVADRATTANEGTLAWTSGYANIPTKKSDDSNLFDVTDNATYLPIPYSTDGSAMQAVGTVMVPTTDMMTSAIAGGFTYTNAPAADELKKPYITLTLYVNGDNWTSDAQQIALPVTSQKFQAGKVYNIILTVPVPVEINARATLNQWGVVSTAVDDEQNIEMTVN